MMRRMSRQSEEHFVAQHSATWHVPSLCLLFSPDNQLSKNGCRSRFELVPSSDTLITFLGFTARVSHGVFQAGELFLSPMQPATLREAGVEMVVNPE
jgi:hypothetical protein